MVCCATLAIKTNTMSKVACKGARSPVAEQGRAPKAGRPVPFLGNSLFLAVTVKWAQTL